MQARTELAKRKLMVCYNQSQKATFTVVIETKTNITISILFKFYAIARAAGSDDHFGDLARYLKRK